MCVFVFACSHGGVGKDESLLLQLVNWSGDYACVNFTLASLEGREKSL